MIEFNSSNAETIQQELCVEYIKSLREITNYFFREKRGKHRDVEIVEGILIGMMGFIRITIKKMIDHIDSEHHEAIVSESRKIMNKYFDEIIKKIK